MAIIPNSTVMQRGIVGTRANMEVTNSKTGFAESVFAAGVPLMKGTNDMDVKPLTAGGRFVGVALRTNDMQGTPLSDGTTTFQIGDLLGVEDMGVVFVLAGAGVVGGGVPYYDTATRKFHGTSAAGRLVLTECEFDESAKDGEPVGLRLRITPGAAVIAAAT